MVERWQFRKVVKRLRNNRQAKAGRAFLRKYIVAIAIGGATFLVVGQWLDSQSWSGFHGRKYGDAKTLWDWMGLLVVPIVLAVGAYLLNRRAELRDKEREEASRQEEILQDYLDDMSHLLLEKDLKASLKKRNEFLDAVLKRDENDDAPMREDYPVVEVARARTVTALRRLKDQPVEKVRARFLTSGRVLWSN